MLVCSDVPSIENLLREKEVSVIFIDIDNTLIQPCSLSAKTGLIDEIKNKKENIPHFEKILSQWRLQRKIELTDPNWPSFIEKLKKKHTVYGLTKMEMGVFGDISSMEDWRYNELKDFGILFSTFKDHMSCASHGVFYADPNDSKGNVVLAFLKHHPSSRIIFIDDVLENLESVQSACKTKNSNFFGIYFKRTLPLPDKEVMDFQYKILTEQYEWIEDEEAALRINKINF